jgi:predicted O-methyltransferase YrrM
MSTTANPPQATTNAAKKPAAAGRPFLARVSWGLSRRLAARAERFAIRRSLAAVGLRGCESLSTYTTREELAALLKLAAACPPGAAALEIGSYLGASSGYLAAGLAQVGGTLTCVDTWQNQAMPDGERDTFAEFQKNLSPVRDRLIMIRKATQELTSAELGGPFHLVFIDGDHSYDAVRRDFELIAPCVAPGGTVAFHDVLYHRGVTQLVGEAMASGALVPLGIVNNLIWLLRQ